MGVADRRLDFGVPEQLPDHAQALAERQGTTMRPPDPNTTSTRYG